MKSEERELLIRAAQRLRVLEHMDVKFVKQAVQDAISLALNYGLQLGKEVKLIVTQRDDGTVVEAEAMIGVYGYQRMMEAWQQNGAGHLQIEDIPADELRQLTHDEYPDAIYDPEDRGARVRFVDHEAAKMCVALNWTYNPPWSFGFWRAKRWPYEDEGGATRYASDWLPEDTSGMNRQELARQKAVRACLRSSIGPRPTDGLTVEERKAALVADLLGDPTPDPADTVDAAPQNPADTARVEKPDLTIQEEDGDILFLRPAKNERGKLPRYLDHYA